MSSYKYLGSALTNANGVATFDYQGTGAGEIDVIASLDKPITDGSIVSGTLPVLDTLLYDTGTDPNHNIWTGSTSNLTRGSEYSRLEESTIGTPVQINTVMPTGLWVLTMSIKRDGHSTNWDITILNNNVSVFGCATPTNDVWTDITLVYDGSFIYYFENGSTTPTKKTSVMLDDTKNTVLRLQTPQDITYLDFKDLIVLREGKSAISIGSSNPVIQSGDTATINGTLYESGLSVKNATLDVYKNGSKVGTVNTGDTGVASYTYTGVADGEVEFQFKYGSILSETYSIFDVLLNADALTDFEIQSGTLTLEDGVFTKSTEGNVNILNPDNPVRYGWSGAKTIEFDVVTVSTLGFQYYSDASHRWVNRIANMGGTNGSHVKIEYDGTYITPYIDGVEKTSYKTELTFTSNYMITILNQGVFRNVVVY